MDLNNTEVYSFSENIIF